MNGHKTARTLCTQANTSYHRLGKIAACKVQVLQHCASPDKLVNSFCNNNGWAWRNLIRSIPKLYLLILLDLVLLTLVFPGRLHKVLDDHVSNRLLDQSRNLILKGYASLFFFFIKGEVLWWFLYLELRDIDMLQCRVCFWVFTFPGLCL